MPEQTFNWLQLPWTAILSALVIAYGVLRWVNRKQGEEQFLTIKGGDAIKDAILSELEDLRSELRAYMPRSDAEHMVNGLGVRVSEVDKRVDGMVSLFDRTAARADAAHEIAHDTSRSLAAFMQLMDERLRPLAGMQSKLEQLSEGQSEMIGHLRALQQK